MADPKEAADFQLIRNAPVDDGVSLTPVLILVVLVGVAVGGYFVYSRPAAPAEPGSGSGAPAEVVDQPVPDFVKQAIAFSEDDGRLDSALSKAEDALLDYPDSRWLKSKVKQLRIDLGLEQADYSGRTAESLLAEGQAQLEAGEHDAAFTLFNAALDKDEDLGAAYLGAAKCLIAQGNQLDAQAWLEDARSVDPELAGEVQRLLASLDSGS